MSAPRFRPCEICGSAAARLFLRSPRLDGPLIRCAVCGHLYVGARRQDFTFTGADLARTQALAARVQALNIVDVAVEEGESVALREGVQRERVQRILRHVRGGRLLDVGAAVGHFLAVAGEHFDAEGVEPDPATAEQARARGLAVRTGALSEVARPEGGYRVITMHHLIEHLDSPRLGLAAARELIAPDGLLVIETPTVDSAVFLLAPARWRQLIPDHYHFFSRLTLCRLLDGVGFVPVAHEKVGRRVSLRFAADRWRRAGLPGAALVQRGVARSGLAQRSIRIVPGDILEVIARPR
ncbi:MAG TPA: class I SAM-dependent methyltransferase [Solirubrobacteraceae bacterium]|nr:class I SAM-dependent methyltransferase [Solirubrobacteraceae bacterium]